MSHSFILPGPAVNGLSCSVVPADPLLKFNYVLCFFFHFFGEANKINKILLNGNQPSVLGMLTSGFIFKSDC